MSRGKRRLPTDASTKRSKIGKQIREEESTLLTVETKIELQPITSLFDSKYIPQTILHRETQQQMIQDFILSKSDIKFMMVTGLPGCGKTLTVNKILDDLEGEICSFRFNAMNFTQFHDFLSEISKRLESQQKVANVQRLNEVLANFIKSEKRQIVLLIDEFELLFRLSPDAYNLFWLCSQNKFNLKLIGLSNDTEWLQLQAKKRKEPLPNINHIVFQAYTHTQMEQILNERINEAKISARQRLDFDPQALKTVVGHASNLKGGDLRHIFDVCKKVIGSKLTDEELVLVTRDDVLNFTGSKVNKEANQDIVDTLMLEQQIILVALFLIVKNDTSMIDIDIKQVCSKGKWLKECMGLDTTEIKEDTFNLLVDYNFIVLKEIKQRKDGNLIRIVKVIPKQDPMAIGQLFKNKQIFKSFFTNL